MAGLSMRQLRPLAASLNVTDAVPVAAAPHILDFQATDLLASDPLAFRTSMRDKVRDIVVQFDDLGIRDTPPGRRDAYMDVCAWGEPDNIRNAFATCPTDANGACIMSSCGMVVRSLWRLLGVRDPLLDPPYKFGWVLTNLIAFARQCGALRDIRNRADLDEANPQRGDAIFIFQGQRQHVLTVIDRDGDHIVSIDGGQGGNGDGGCCGIRRRERNFQPGMNKFTDDSRPIQHVVNVEYLQFAAPIIDVIRHTPGASAQSLGRARLFDAQCFADRHPDDFVVLAAFHHVRSEYHKEPTMAGQRRRLDNRKFNVQLHIDGGIHEFEVMWRTDGHLNVHGLTPPYAEWSCNYTFNCDDDPPRFSKGACIYANPGF